MTTPKFPELPKIPRIPDLSGLDYEKWNEEWQEEIRKYELELERFNQEQSKFFDENYDTNTYTDKDGFFVREIKSKDGKSLIITRTKIFSSNGIVETKTEIWNNGQRLFSNTKRTSANSSGSKRNACGSLKTLIIGLIIIIMIISAIFFL